MKGAERRTAGKTEEKVAGHLNPSTESDSPSGSKGKFGNPVQQSTEKSGDSYASIVTKHDTPKEFSAKKSDKLEDPKDSDPFTPVKTRRSQRTKVLADQNGSLDDQVKSLTADSPENPKSRRSGRTPTSGTKPMKPKRQSYRDSKNPSPVSKKPPSETPVMGDGSIIEAVHHSQSIKAAATTGDGTNILQESIVGNKVENEDKKVTVLPNTSSPKSIMDVERYAMLMQKAFSGKASADEIHYVREMYDTLGSILDFPHTQLSAGNNQHKISSCYMPSVPIGAHSSKMTATKNKSHENFNIRPSHNNTIDLTSSPKAEKDCEGQNHGWDGAMASAAAEFGSRTKGKHGTRMAATERLEISPIPGKYNVNTVFAPRTHLPSKHQAPMEVQGDQHAPHHSHVPSIRNLEVPFQRMRNKNNDELMMTHGGPHSTRYQSKQLTSKRANERIQKNEHATRKLQKTLNELQQQLQSKSTHPSRPPTPPASPAPLPSGPYGQMYPTQLYGTSTVPSPAWQYGYYAHPQIIAQPSSQLLPLQLPPSQFLPNQIAPIQIPNHSSQYSGYPSQYGYPPQPPSYGQQQPMYHPRNP